MLMSPSRLAFREGAHVRFTTLASEVCESGGEVKTASLEVYEPGEAEAILRLTVRKRQK